MRGGVREGVHCTSLEVQARAIGNQLVDDLEMAAMTRTMERSPAVLIASIDIDLLLFQEVDQDVELALGGGDVQWRLERDGVVEWRRALAQELLDGRELASTNGLVYGVGALLLILLLLGHGAGARLAVDSVRLALG